MLFIKSMISRGATFFILIITNELKKSVSKRIKITFTDFIPLKLAGNISYPMVTEEAGFSLKQKSPQRAQPLI